MKFIDLYAGIGGFRLALENLGGECVLSAERDKKCRETYSLNFTIDHPYADDVAELATTPQNVPEFDFLTAGFPCQPFSSCLLYTSPSPRDRQKSRMPSSA